MKWPWGMERGIYFYLHVRLDHDSTLFQEFWGSAQRGYWLYLADELILWQRVFAFIENDLQGLMFLDKQKRLRKNGVVNLNGTPQAKIILSDGDLTMLKCFVADKNRIPETKLATICFDDNSFGYLKYNRRLGLYLD